MNIRFQGLSSEAELFRKALKLCPGITITRESKDYADRNSVSVRRYIDIELDQEVLDKFQPTDSVIPVKGVRVEDIETVLSGGMRND